MRPHIAFTVKLASGLLLTLLFVAGAAVFSLRHFAHLAEEREAISRRYGEDLLHAERLRSAKDQVAASNRGYLITGSPEALERVENAGISFNQALHRLRLRARADNRMLVEAVSQMSADYRDAQRHILHQKLAGTGMDVIVEQLEREVVPKLQALSTAIDALVARVQQLQADQNAEAHVLRSRAMATSVVVIAIAALISLLLLSLMVRHLARCYQQEHAAVTSARRAVAARDTLLGVVAHDLRSPLQAITLRAGLAERLATDDRLRRQSEAIGRVAIGMERLIQSLLDASSIEAGGFSVSPSPCSVEAILNDTINLVGNVATHRSIELVTRVETDAWVMADRSRIVQVLTNIVGNALKFTTEGDKVAVRIERTNGEVQFTVQDNGPGIAREHLAHVFDPFWKAERGGKHSTGLGLHIAKAIVEKHGGRIWIESQLGRGTRVIFTLQHTRPGTDVNHG